MSGCCIRKSRRMLHGRRRRAISTKGNELKFIPIFPSYCIDFTVTIAYLVAASCNDHTIINDSLAFEISLIRFIDLIYSDCKLPFLCSWGNDLMYLSKDSQYTLPIATFTLICIPSSCLLLIVYKVLLFANLSCLALHLCYFLCLALLETRHFFTSAIDMSLIYMIILSLT